MVSMAHASSRTGADDTSRSRDADRFRFDTDALPAKDRIAVFREGFGRQMLRLDMEPLPASRFHADATVTSLPGLDMVWALNSPLCARPHAATSAGRQRQFPFSVGGLRRVLHASWAGNR